MKRLITLLALLLAGPPLASGQFIATGGGTSVDQVSTTYPFAVFGPAFGMEGDFSFGIPFLCTTPSDCTEPIAEGTQFSFTLEVSTESGTITDIGVGLASGPLTDPQGFVDFEAEDITVPGPGTHFDPFLFESEFISPEGDFTFFGHGTITYQVVPTGTPGLVSIVSANYNVVTEPSTTPLLLFGLTGLALVGRRGVRRQAARA